MKRENNVFYSVLFGAAISLGVLAGVSLLCAIIVNMTEDPLAASNLGALISLLVSAAISGILISKRAQGSKMLIASLSSLLFCLTLLIVGLAISGGELSGRVFLNYLCYIGVALLSAKLATKKPRHRRRGK